MATPFSRIASAAAIAVGSFFLGQNVDIKIPGFHSGKAATAVVPADRASFTLDKLPEKPSTVEPWTQPSRAAEIMKFGWPGFDNLRTYEDFVLSYDRRTRTAHWVIEHLTPDRLVYDPSVDRSKCDFRPDISIHEYFRSQNTDYLVCLT